MTLKRRATVFNYGGGLAVHVMPEDRIYLLDEVYNPDTLGALNNPEEFVYPEEGDDITDIFENYLKLRPRS